MPMTKTILAALALTFARGPVLAADKPIKREEAVAACVKNREKAFECKEPFIDAMVAFRLRGKEVPPDLRAKMREKGLKEIAEEGSGPLPPRQAKCEAMVDKLAERNAKIDRGTLAKLDACYAEKDCGKRVACMMPIMEAIMAPKGK